MMAFSFAECRRGVGASILQLLWLTLKGYNHCKQTKVEDIREFSPGSSPLCMYVHAKSLSRVRLFVTLWTVAHQAPLSLGFPREEYWSGLPFPSSGDLPNPGVKPASFALAGEFFTTELPEKPSFDLGTGISLNLSQ